MPTLQDVKFSIHPILEKFSGVKQEPFSNEEIKALVFALESNVLFDNVAHKFVPSLKSLPQVPELVLNGDETEEEKEHKENEVLVALKERSEMVRTILLTILKDSILREMSIRFGI